MPDTSRFRAEVACDECGTTGPHELTYAGRLLVRTRCERCAHVVVHDESQLRTDYLSDLEARLRSKPARMMRRLGRDPVRYVVGIPVSIALKPLRMVNELRTVRRRR